MIKILISHSGYYLSLGIMMLLCLSLILKTANEPSARMLFLAMTAIFYVFWGIAHHIVHHDITIKIVLEYVLTGVLGMSLALLII